MEDVGTGLGVKSISDLVLKEIHGNCEKKLKKEKLNAIKWLKENFMKSFIN